MASIQSRWFHASTLINTTLYFTGGTTTGINLNKTSMLDETLALDLSQPWSIDKPLFKTLPPLRIPLSGHSMNKVPGTTRLLVAGGESTSKMTTSPILLYDTIQQNTTSMGWFWAQLPLRATASFRRLYHASIDTGKDGILLQGGYRTTVKNGTAISSSITLKSSNNFAPQSTAPVAKAPNPPVLARHTMVLTASGHAIVLGGINSQGVLANLSTAHVMDTKSSSPQWQAMPLLGKPPDPRMAFTTVMVNSTTLLLYGGTEDFKSAYWVAFYLDLPSRTWSSPTAYGTIPRRWGHTATMTGNIMIIAFGKTLNRL
ncbi:hypothetical protein BGZ65_009311 [Modicella reniformis]|uniref:Galactose oxidase n=1 Tax=Modicella reniformis TaxID=1440133 RepID=A0A9P6IMT1_9FUNG|nr:hypothetical protein BGZ65_009311 [Modicella reniformis]